MGRKRWVLLEPAEAMVSTTPTSRLDWDGRWPPSARQCVQGPGDLMYVPSMYAHAVVNLDDVVSVAVEFYV